MKTLKSIILGLATVLSVSAVSAKSINPAAEKISVNYAVETYVNAMTHGANNGLNDVIDNNFKQTMLRGDKMESYNKTQVLEFMKSTENVEQDCKTSTSVNESNADLTVVKVDMKYKGFTRTNYVTLANTAEGWKITSVYSVFKS